MNYNNPNYYNNGNYYNDNENIQYDQEKYNRTMTKFNTIAKYDENNEFDERKLLFNDENKEFVDFKNNVKEWVSLDDDLKTLANAIKERRHRKQLLNSEITKYMKRYKISDLKTEGGKIQCYKSTVTRSLSKNTIITRLTDYFKDIGQGEIVAQYIMKGREKVESYKLKRIMNKKEKEELKI
jgi:hypothetical protein